MKKRQIVVDDLYNFLYPCHDVLEGVGGGGCVPSKVMPLGKRPGFY